MLASTRLAGCFIAHLFGGASRMVRRERLVRESSGSLLRLGYLLLPTPSFKAICYTSDSNLFACILNNSCNVGLLHKLLPRPSVPPPCMPDSPKVQTCPLFGAARTSYRSFLNPNK